MKRLPARTARQVFVLPAWLALFSLTGLILALTGEGWRDWLSFGLLVLPLLALAIAWARRG